MPKRFEFLGVRTRLLVNLNDPYVLNGSYVNDTLRVVITLRDEVKHGCLFVDQFTVSTK